MADTVKWGAILFKAQAVLREVGSSGETSASFTTVSSRRVARGLDEEVKT